MTLHLCEQVCTYYEHCQRDICYNQTCDYGGLSRQVKTRQMFVVLLAISELNGKLRCQLSLRKRYQCPICEQGDWKYQSRVNHEKRHKISPIHNFR